ncbi:UbiD family decarboxylase [Cupriavidus oxalaticus]|uniref:4-Hydroxybenzoate decarboxylase n=1 Tax=Cupriavidus oxalaticus TaxID=96344 RepID=A0A375FJQ4_9BURK|nr:UbiD family decarboxylase [Cupriavidus oxalaticus]QEZ44371.1 UbiD family decarboxylase [Cupriavidus oxalaticus]QRQ84263.1 UbiD family decarboxylase [Cupriavidus oxalaticus]QRQ91651.1 UbiD family decarboxylase [Cupriavidus oxalaticus]WQD86230.1 UbiD family decarboxylase [Cupriavidus oxalaticus]SPC05149.1 4-Hydroxybenzoate decarboxylase [Cupriavidus oxalaticus]
MRHYLSRLQARGDLAIVEREVDPRFEAAAIARRLQRVSNQAVLFKNVRGSALPVVMNLYSDHERLREMIRCGTRTFCERLDEEIDVAATLQTYAEEDSQPERLESGKLSDLPILTYHERDGAPYITSGVFLARDPDTGVPNLSFHRSMVISDHELRIRLGSSHDLARYQAAAEQQGKALEAAILIGAPPEVFMSACVSLPPQANELALAAAMRGGPLRTRRCQTIDLCVPAATDIVIEGRILPNVRRPEGPFGEFMGYYVEVGDNHVFEVTHVSWRKGAIFHGLICGSDEDLRPLEAATAARIYRAIKGQVPGIIDVSCKPTVMNTVIKLRKQYEGHAQHALLAAMGAHLDYNKLCMVVDEDVDIYNLDEVIWAFVTRGRADTRTMVLNNVPGFYRDPHKDHWGRLAIDATKPWGREAEFERKRIPGEAEIELGKYLPAFASEVR